MKHVVTLVALVAWVFGIAVAKGFWLTLGAVLLAPLGWVLVALWIMERL